MTLGGLYSYYLDYGAYKGSCSYYSINNSRTSGYLSSYLSNIIN